MPKRGRPPGTSPKLTSEIQDAICRDLEIGVTEKYAAEGNGIDESTFHEWMKKGGSGIVPYADFCRAVKCARARTVRNLIVRGLAGGSGSSVAAWLLGRRFPQEYGSHVRISGISGADPIRIEDETRTAEMLRNSPAAMKQINGAILTAMTDAAPSRGGKSSRGKH